jgi:hypothetical protein
MKNILWKINRFFNNQCALAVLDEAAGRWIVRPESKNISYLKAENANGRHILVKPDQHISPYYLLVDDLNINLLNSHHKSAVNIFKFGRMVVETSPGNYQVWIHSLRPLSLDVKRYWLKRLHSDPGADPHNRWGRCPGFRNRKQKHRTSSGHYPLAKLIWVDWKNKANIPEIRIPSHKKKTLSHQPQGGVCHENVLTRSYYEKGDESATDFAYALALYRRGVSQAEISQRISVERKNWNHHTSPKKIEDYLCRTLTKAANIINQN